MTDVPPPSNGAKVRRPAETLVILALALVLLVAVGGLVVSAVVRENEVALSNLALISSAVVGVLAGYVGARATQKAVDSASNTTPPPAPPP